MNKHKPRSQKYQQVHDLIVKDRLTQAEVAQYFGCTRQRIQQICKRMGIGWESLFRMRNDFREGISLPHEVLCQFSADPEKAKFLLLKYLARKIRAAKRRADFEGVPCNIQTSDLMEIPIFCPAKLLALCQVDERYK